MRKLSKTQTLILSRASQRGDHIALPLPDHLSGAAARTVVRLLLEKHLLDEVDANLRKNDPLWRETGDGHGTTLVITDAGLEAIGLETATRLPDPEPAKPKQRTGTKQAMLIAMLRAPDGATIAEIVTALEWQPHYADIGINLTRCEAQLPTCTNAIAIWSSHRTSPRVLLSASTASRIERGPALQAGVRAAGDRFT